jgi:hypothetical protein
VLRQVNALLAAKWNSSGITILVRCHSEHSEESLPFLDVFRTAETVAAHDSGISSDLARFAQGDNPEEFPDSFQEKRRGVGELEQTGKTVHAGVVSPSPRVIAKTPAVVTPGRALPRACWSHASTGTGVVRQTRSFSNHAANSSTCGCGKRSMAASISMIVFIRRKHNMYLIFRPLAVQHRKR